ncbi:Putative S-adenosyl-L-methionine-dependent methyltransferase superfamily [Colletotrichum destructivum]|uniref:S-adenosyl-L-methionine-dependent methyltransferase superfamily n=1 Tax=Colletotrichum destructivum TaxID=34406 RepID=A0AAX4IWX1_9PEZI|nr:Putative S-adenosyl-L-methionine-dependent methyltransferase superfamily [Colletotrichum destructivum]
MFQAEGPIVQDGDGLDEAMELIVDDARECHEPRCFGTFSTQGLTKLQQNFRDDVSDMGDSLAPSTKSLTRSIFEHRVENGRTYHKYKDGKYLLPNDDDELDRLDLQHHLFKLTFNGRLGNAPPIDKDAIVRRVLDLGTGSGVWAIEYGDEHPGAEVIGVDLAPTQPNLTPPNVRFVIDDVEESWTYSKPFDYIHSRMMNSNIGDWNAYIKQCFEYVNET